VLLLRRSKGPVTFVTRGRAGTESGTGRVGGRYPFEVLTELQTVVLRPH
jgi:hypothetical protein